MKDEIDERIRSSVDTIGTLVALILFAAFWFAAVYLTVKTTKLIWYM